MTGRARLRILSLSPFPPDPHGAHGGARVLGQILDGTAQRHEVALFCLRGPDEAPVPDRLRAQLGVVEEVVRSPDDDSRLRALARLRLLRGRPVWATQLWSEDAAARLRVLSQTFRPDVIRIEYPVMAQYARLIADPRTLLLVPDPPYQAARDRAHVFGGRLSALEVRAWRAFERQALRAADATVAFTEKDLLLLDVPPGRIRRAIPIGAALDAPALDARGEDGRVVFVGSFHHAPNADAAKHLIDDLFPSVASRAPSATLRLVGAGLGAVTGERVEAVGRVEDITEELDRAAVVVAPLRLGGGARVKVADALVAGKACVAYPRAVEGIPVESGQHLIVAPDAHSFADAIVELLASPERRAALGAAARDWALVQLRWELSLDQFDNLYDELLAR